MSAILVQKRREPTLSPAGRERVGPGSGQAPASDVHVLQNPEASVAEIRDALLIEAGFPPVG